MQKADYLGLFESKFRRLREEGAPGYNSPEMYRNSLCKVSEALARNDVDSGKVLELGCGAGDLSLLLSEQGFHSFGIDISPTAIDWACEKAKMGGFEAEFRVGNVLELPYQNEQFEVVIDALCWHCIIGEDRKVFLWEALRVLKPSGLFIVMTKCGDPPEGYPFDPVTRCKIENGVAARYWGLPDSLASELKACRFQIVNSVVYDTYKQNLFFAEAGPA